MIRRIDRTQNKHEELLEQVKVETSYFQMAEEMTTEEIIKQHILIIEQLTHIKIGTIVNT